MVGTGGPVVPIEALHLCSALLERFNKDIEIKIIDMGVGQLSLEDIQKEIRLFRPEVIFLNSLAWEADIAHSIAFLAKELDKNIIVVAQGQLPSLAKGFLLQDKNIDCLIAGEPELTAPELIMALESNSGLSAVRGVIYRDGRKIVEGKPRKYIEDLDNFNISYSAWNLIDVKQYSRYSNWNGSLKEKFYMPILTSRGCPFDCVFCCNGKIAGKSFRARSPKNVLSEIIFLRDKFGAKEIHIFDPVFNCDLQRAKEICQLIIDSGIKISLAFPHGLRADLMTDELIDLLKKAGTYKLVYGIETGSSRLQKKIKKNLDLGQVSNCIDKTSQKGIIVGGYFMLGFPGEKVQEMLETIDFAAGSKLDLAAFFKVASFDAVIELYKTGKKRGNFLKKGFSDFQDLGYYSDKRSLAGIPASQLNSVILLAQQKFYLNWPRIKRSFWKTSNKIIFLINFFKALSLILQGYIIRKLTDSQRIIS